MQMVLTGDSISAAEAKDCGLVSEVVPKEETVDRAVAIATKIATMSNPVVGMAKVCEKVHVCTRTGRDTVAFRG